MEKITKILAGRQMHFNTISPLCTVSEALCRMGSQNADYLIVMDEDNSYLGLLSEHDIARQTIFSARPVTQMKVSELMNTRLPHMDAGHTVDECMQAMKRYRIRYLPVFDSFSFLGIITSDDILEEAVRNRNKIFDEEGSASSAEPAIG